MPVKTPLKIVIILLVASAAVAAVVLKKNRGIQPSNPAAQGAITAAPAPASTAPLPKLLDLGAGKCIPCKAMAPILEDLRKDFAGQFDVVFIDVWTNPEAGTNYNIGLIPTQIFFNSAGRELYRHQGFFGRDDILGKWTELGFNFKTTAASATRTLPR